MLVGALDRLIGNVALDVLLKISGSIIPGLLGAVFLLVLFRYTPDQSGVEVGLGRGRRDGADARHRGMGIRALSRDDRLRSASGVAGTLLLGLAFVHYSAQMLLYGVEITKATYDRSG